METIFAGIIIAIVVSWITWNWDRDDNIDDWHEIDWKD